MMNWRRNIKQTSYKYKLLIKTSHGRTPLRRLICSAEYDNEVKLNVLLHVNVK